jgi:hypothetical protein
MHTCFLLAYVSVMMIIYQETDVVYSLFYPSLFSCAHFCCSSSSNTILLTNSHQFIHRKGERERARGANKTFIEVVPCDSLSVVVRSFPFSFLFFFFFCMLKENSIISLSLRLIFFIDGTFAPFP